jgi:hypothetical protein
MFSLEKTRVFVKENAEPLIYLCDIFHKVILQFFFLFQKIPKCNVLVTRKVSCTFRDMSLGISANPSQIPNIPYSFVRGRAPVG